MRRICKIAAITVASLCVGIAPGNAATITNQGGAVFVSKGEGFAPIAAQAELDAGGRVMVRPGGQALITYANGCSVRVGSGVWMVQASAPCNNGAREIDFTGRMNQMTDPGEPEPEPSGSGITTGMVVAGGLVVAGAVGLAVLLSQDSDKKPASP